MSDKDIPKTCDEACKKYPGLRRHIVSELTGTSTETINNWFRNPKKQRLFQVVLIGCYVMRAMQSNKDFLNQIFKMAEAEPIQENGDQDGN